MDPNWIMALIALSAIISPAIVSIIDNRFKYKSKELELSYPNKIQALTSFINIAMQYYVADYFNDTVNYETAKNNLYIYFDNVPTAKISKLKALRAEKKIDEYRETLNSIANVLSQQIHK